MHSKVLCVLFAVFVAFQRSSVESLELRVLTSGSQITNQRIAASIPSEQERYITTTSCGGVLTQAPGQIKQNFELGVSKNTQCKWTIHAPKDHSIYVRSLTVSLTSLPGKSIGDITDSINVQVYEGSSPSISKRLFNFKHDTSLDKCISKSQTITIVLNYEESGLHAEHEISLKYGFVKRSKISHLLN